MGESIVYALKVALVLVLSVAFFAAIGTIMSVIVDLFANGVPDIVREVIAVICSFLPFKAGTVFASILASFDAICTFFIAKKVYDIAINNHKAT